MSSGRRKPTLTQVRFHDTRDITLVVRIFYTIKLGFWSLRVSETRDSYLDGPESPCLVRYHDFCDIRIWLYFNQLSVEFLYKLWL